MTRPRYSGPTHGPITRYLIEEGQKKVPTYYELLGVSCSAEPDVLKAARQRIARDAHPDRGGDADLMARANVAYDALSDPKTHRAYRTALRSLGYRKECPACKGAGETAKQRGFKQRVVELCDKCKGVGLLR